MGAPPRTGRHNQWTRAKMVAFLRELAATQSVAAAARAVGMSRTSAYNLRNRLAGQPFALGWEVALECGMHALAHAVMDRAVNGEEVPLYYHGELVGTTRRYDNRLAQWILENPWRVGRHQMAREYAAGGFDALLERIESAALDWEAASRCRVRAGRRAMQTQPRPPRTASCAIAGTGPRQPQPSAHPERGAMVFPDRVRSGCGVSRGEARNCGAGAVLDEVDRVSTVSTWGEGASGTKRSKVHAKARRTRRGRVRREVFASSALSARNQGFTMGGIGQTRQTKPFVVRGPEIGD